MRHYKWVSQLRFCSKSWFVWSIGLILLQSPSAALAIGAGSFTDIKMTPELNFEAEARGELRTDASELADILEIRPYVDRLREHRKLGPVETASLPKPLVHAKFICLTRIFTASEEVRRLSARIDADLATSNVALGDLCNKRDNTRNMINTLNFMQGGILGITKQSMFLNGNLRRSNYPLIVSTSVGTGLAVLNTFLPNIYRNKIGQPENTLVHFLNPKYRPPDAEYSYLWKFFTSQIPGSSYGLTRREVLVKHWHDFAKLNEKDQLLERKLTATPNPNEHLSEDINVLSMRITLLHDLKTHVEEIDGCLYELQKSIRSE